MAVDMTLAYKLREEGKTFREMAIELGCSEVWLRTSMVGVPKGKKYEPGSVSDDLKRISRELAEIAKKIEKTL